MSGEPASIPEFEGRHVPCHVRLQSFRGPMEVLLHLIRTEEIDVSDVPIVDVARQYDAYLDGMRRIDLEAAGEYLLIAATLTHLKSRRLLPADPAMAEEADEIALDEAAILAGLPLLRRAAEHLQEREAAMELVYHRPAGRISEFAGEQGIEADLFSLVKALQAVLVRVQESERAIISRERMSLVDRLNWLIETLQRKARIPFGELFEGVPDRLTCILTFLALLEAIRLRVARALIRHRGGDILIVSADGGADVRDASAPEPRPHA